MRAIFRIIQFSGFMLMLGAAGNNNADFEVTVMLLFIGLLVFAGTETVERRYIYWKKHAKTSRRKKVMQRNVNYRVSYVKKEAELC